MDWEPDAKIEDGYICPPCPIFYPTVEEFKHPLKYITSIRHIGEKSGICKIVPPVGWKPPFAINEKTFRFRTRVQQLNCIEGHSRAEGNFVENLRIFLYRNGTPMKELPHIDGQLVNLLSLYKAVCDNGGYAAVCKQSKSTTMENPTKGWTQIVRQVGRTKASMTPTKALCNAYKKIYTENLLCYEQRLIKNTNKLQSTPKSSSSQSLHLKTPDSVSSHKKKSVTPSTKPRDRSCQKKRPRHESESGSNDTDTNCDKLSSLRQINSSTTQQRNQNNDQPALKLTRRTLFSDKSDGVKANKVEPNNTFENETINSDMAERSKSANIEPSSLFPPPNRRIRLSLPPMTPNQKFYQFFPDTGAVIGQILRVTHAKKPQVFVKYENSDTRVQVEFSTMQIIIANGWSPEAAELAFKSEICQTCLRGDCWDKMLLCDSCNGGHHIFCLNNPLEDIPPGDWYCDACVDDSQMLMDSCTGEEETILINPKFGFEMGAEYDLLTYKMKADEWMNSYFGFSTENSASSSKFPFDVTNDVNNPIRVDQVLSMGARKSSMVQQKPEKLTDKELEQEYWRLLSMPVHEQRLEVEYGSDIDSGVCGSGFPRLDTYAKCVRVLNRRLKMLYPESSATDLQKKLCKLFSVGLEIGSTKENFTDSLIASRDHLEKMLQQYASEDWNLNNLPKLSGSVLQHLDEDIKGVMIPWIYVGMCFSTFCWHVEDHNFYSVSYLHCGAPKTWYGVPGHSAAKFELKMKEEFAPELFGAQPDLHLQLVTMFSPEKLQAHGIPVYRATHNPNEFMVTFPSAYHGGFNNGFNCAEAVNFATIDWLPWGAAAVEKYRLFQKMPVFSHDALLFQLAESAADESSIDELNSDAIRESLLPAVQGLYASAVQFEEHVLAHGINRKEDMDKYTSRHGMTELRNTQGNSELPRRAVKMKMSQNYSHAPVHPVKLASSKQLPSVRMKTGWAGASGKAKGLQCNICKQYCFVQAVVCTRCRYGTSVVACNQHYEDMCKCDPAEHYKFLYRHPASYIKHLLERITRRIHQIDEWNKEFDRVLQICSNAENGHIVSANKFVLPTNSESKSVTIFEQILNDGLHCNGVNLTKLNALKIVVEEAHRWTDQAEYIMYRDVKRPTMDQIVDLYNRAMKLVAIPARFEEVRQVVESFEDHSIGEKLVLEVTQIQCHEEEHQQYSNMPWHILQQSLLRDNTKFHSMLKEIETTCRKLENTPFQTIENFQLVGELTSSKNYLELLCCVNQIIIRITAPNHIVCENYVSEQKYWQVITKIKQLKSASQVSIHKADYFLVSILPEVEQNAHDLHIALQSNTNNREALVDLCDKLKKSFVKMDGYPDLAAKVVDMPTWESRASIYLNRSPWNGLRQPHLEEIEAFIEETKSHLVPQSSLLRRQIVQKLEDCRRWSHNTLSLFVSLSSQTPQLYKTLDHFLQEAIQRIATNSLKPPLLSNWSTHCVCDQIVTGKTRAKTITCMKCSSIFHPQCLNMSASEIESSKNSFICKSCLPKTRYQSRTMMEGQTNCEVPGEKPRFCLCREVENDSMICCDVCDEWYHTTCVGLSYADLQTFTNFRCQRCMVRQNLFYLDPVILKRCCFGKQPKKHQVERSLLLLRDMLAQPCGSNELLTYLDKIDKLLHEAISFIESFKQHYSINEQKDVHDRYMVQVIQLLARVVSLEMAIPGLNSCPANSVTVYSKLVGIHWYLRACELLVHSKGPPKYTHLYLLLEDAEASILSSNGFVWINDEVVRVERTIRDRVERATMWIKQLRKVEATRSIEIDKRNFAKQARQSTAQSYAYLVEEYRLLSQYLELPTAEVAILNKLTDAL